MNRDELREKIAAVRRVQGQGVSVAVSPTLYPTPPDVADRMVGYLDMQRGMSALEPSAGTGRLLDAFRRAFPDSPIHAIERDPRLAALSGAECADFLECSGSYDRVIMNPPFNGGDDIRHIQHARRMLRPGGVLVAICVDGPRRARAFADWEWIERLPSGTFAGTGVRSAIIQIQNGSDIAPIQ